MLVHHFARSVMRPLRCRVEQCHTLPRHSDDSNVKLSFLEARRSTDATMAPRVEVKVGEAAVGEVTGDSADSRRNRRRAARCSAGE